MIYLIDTNILSEVRKGQHCHPNVAAWYASAGEGDLYLSVLVIGEIRRGIELLRRRDLVQAAMLENWANTISATFGDRILPIDRAIADEWGRLSAIRAVPIADGLLAATARAHGMTLATRNGADVAGLGVEVLDPFRYPGK